MNELLRRLLFLPEQASTMARPLDYLHYFVVLTTILASIIIGTVAVLFFVRYRRLREFERTPHVYPKWWFEVAVITVPLVLFLLWFGIGYRQWVQIATPPANSMEVYVMGKQWMWKFAYPDGPNSIGVLHVPARRPVKLLITSRDVIHSFFVPAFRLKRDALPGRYTQLWFTATKPGRYPIYCAEYCGVNHSTMLGEVVVHEPEDFDRWLETQRRGMTRSQDSGELPAGESPTLSNLAAQGRRVAAQIGCLNCHTVDGTPHIGPTWLDMYRREVTLQSGQKIIADEAYLTESMMDPMAKVHAGYAPVMPVYQGRLTAPETAAILEYIKSLRTDKVQPTPSQGPVYERIGPRR